MTTATTTIPVASVKPLTNAEAKVLDFLKTHEGHSTKMIAEKLKLPTTSVSTYVFSLFKRGLITKQADESDGRVMRFFPVRERHVTPGVDFSGKQMPVVYTPGSEALPKPTPDPETAAFNALTSGIRLERSYDALADALKVASKMLDSEVQKPENYDLVLTFHLGGVISHLSKILQRRARS